MIRFGTQQEWINPIHAFAEEYARQVEKDYEEYCADYDKGFFKVTFNSANVKNGVNTVLAKLNSSKYQFDIKQEEVDKINYENIPIPVGLRITLSYTYLYSSGSKPR